MDTADATGAVGAQTHFGHRTEGRKLRHTKREKPLPKRHNEETIAGKHRKMRRADREVLNTEIIEAIIDSCEIVRLAYVDAEGLTIVPLDFGYEYSAMVNTDGHFVMYAHGAKEGRKHDAVLAHNNALPVSFEMDTELEILPGRTLCNWGRAYKSVIGNGILSIVEDVNEARKGLKLLMEHEAKMPISQVEFTDAQVKSVAVWKIEADYLTAKWHKKF